MKLNAVWDMPDMATSGAAPQEVVGHIVNDWQLSGILPATPATGTTSGTASRTTART